MNLRERFSAVMDYASCQHVPCWYFGTWAETKQRWQAEGCPSVTSLTGDAGPQLSTMDAEWEPGMWDAHRLVNPNPLIEGKSEVLEETDAFRVVRDPLGGVVKHSKRGSSIPEHLEYPLKPTRQSWDALRRCLDPHDPRRRPEDWLKKAAGLKTRDHVITFMAASLYGWPRNWMGVEQLSYLAYDDPALLEEILEHLADFFVALYSPVLRAVDFDFAYIFEDCCFNTGPLLSPELYRQFYARHYRRLIDFYHASGIRWVLLDSDGKVDDLLPCWLDSGVDIVFPIEVGTWRADPLALRAQYGKRLRMMGGFDKHLIPRGEKAIRQELLRLRPLVAEGGFIPLPDHRIPPDCSWQQFETYVRVFKEVFWQ